MTTLVTKIGTIALAAAIMVVPAFALANWGDKKGTSFAPRSVGSSLEVIISDNGNTTVRGAKVTGVSGSTITAQTIWDASSITWTVRTDSETNFIQKSGSDSDLGDISEGDYVSFSGALASGSSFTVTADVVKNWSLAENRLSLAGTVTDVDDSSFNLSTIARGNVTVRVNSDTDYTGNLEALGDVDVDAKVVAYGSYDPATKVLTATSVSLSGKAAVVKDYREPQGNAWGHWMKKVSGFFGKH